MSSVSITSTSDGIGAQTLFRGMPYPSQKSGASTCRWLRTNCAKAYVGSACLASLLRPMLGEARRVAIWLPPSRGAALANVALASDGAVYEIDPRNARAVRRVVFPIRFGAATDVVVEY